MHPVLTFLFSFRGRIGRAQWWGGTFGAWAAFMVTSAVLLLAMAVLGFRGYEWLPVAIPILAFFWSVWALAAKRVRDTGYPVGITIVLIILASFVSSAISTMLEKIAVNSDPVLTLIAALIAMVIGFAPVVFLGCMPSHDASAKPQERPESFFQPRVGAE
jgi:uncharacterized membrane protein YhaH (DUF805 family)